MIEVRDVELTPQDMRPAAKAWPSMQWWWSLPLVALLLGFLAALFLLTYWETPGPAGDWLPLILLGQVFGVVIFSLVAQTRLAAMHRATPLGHAPADFVIDEDGLTINSALSRTFYDWRGLVRIVEEKDRFVFAASPALAHVVPKRCLTPEQLDSVRALIERVRASGRLGRGVD